MADYTPWDVNDYLPGQPFTSAKAISYHENLDAALEGASDAPIAQTGWHPYNMVNVGDGNDGVIWDFAVDGAVGTIDTPTFEDGYEYQVLMRNVAHSSNVTLIAQVSYNNGSSHATVYTSDATLGPYTLWWMSHHTRVQTQLHYHEILNLEASTGTGEPVGYRSTRGSNDAVDYIRMNTASGNFSGGQVYLFRRRD